MVMQKSLELMDLILLLMINLAIVAVTYILLMWKAIGYPPSNLAQLHEFDLFVAKSANEAKERAIATFLVDSQQQHIKTI